MSKKNMDDDKKTKELEPAFQPSDNDRLGLKLMSDRNHTMLYGNIAVPYARTIYDIASESEQYDYWSDQIGLLAHIACEPPIQRLLDNPLISRYELADVFIDICGETLSTELRKFLYMLAQNNRLQHIVRIALEYERMKRGKIGSIPFEIHTAFPLSKKQKEIIEEGLHRRFKKTPKITEVVDPSVKAGAVIMSGDTVIDGSISKRVKDAKSNVKKAKKGKLKGE